MSAQINVLDRCDADEAERPYVWLYNEKLDLTLSFCAHHFDENLYLLAFGYDIVKDEREELEEKLGASV